MLANKMIPKYTTSPWDGTGAGGRIGVDPESIPPSSWKAVDRQTGCGITALCVASSGCGITALCVASCSKKDKKIKGTDQPQMSMIRMMMRRISRISARIISRMIHHARRPSSSSVLLLLLLLEPLPPAPLPPLPAPASLDVVCDTRNDNDNIHLYSAAALRCCPGALTVLQTVKHKNSTTVTTKQ